MKRLKSMVTPALVAANLIAFAVLVGPQPALADGDPVDGCDEETGITCDCLPAFEPWFPAGCYDNAGAGDYCTTGDECAHIE